MAASTQGFSEVARTLSIIGSKIRPELNTATQANCHPLMWFNLQPIWSISNRREDGYAEQRPSPRIRRADRGLMRAQTMKRNAQSFTLPIWFEWLASINDHTCKTGFAAPAPLEPNQRPAVVPGRGPLSLSRPTPRSAAMNYLLAAQSLAYLAASASWMLVWRNPSRTSIGYAGLAKPLPSPWLFGCPLALSPEVASQTGETANCASLGPRRPHFQPAL